ncbi:MAG: succinate dehydrogenase, hydrophobic membrane anchor protein [Cognatishimia sp.]|uniref:succinate dehydrogenase, hydrophobic membrane anchor protein n=1 Tax=Cognatishimia sp. TaxID=2211648 RepID=UPI003B8E1487
MRYLTDRKRAEGNGSGRQGTMHHWQMLVSSILMVVVVPVFIFTFGTGFGGSYEEVLAFFARPCPAIATGLTMTVIILHVMREAHEAIEDYMHGIAERLAIIATTALAYTLIATAVFALIKLAL